MMTFRWRKMTWARPLAATLLTAGIAAVLFGYGVLGAVLLIFGGAGVVDVFQRERRARRAELLEAIRQGKVEPR